MIRCSAATGPAGEPLAGTAPVTRRWLAVEHHGPWGREVTTDAGARLTALARRANEAGARLTLIRPVHRRPDTGLRRVFLAETAPGRTVVRGLWLPPERVADVSFDAGDEVPEPVLLVCAHARRDRCCAIDGRALARGLADQGADVWLCSHLGGHRFAPTAVVLPTGYVHGRLTVDLARRVLDATARGELEPAGQRGRSTWSRAGQVAELAVRERLVEHRADALTVTDAEGGALVRHVDGRSWHVAVEHRTLPGSRPQSCGKPDEPITTLVATAVEPVARLAATPA
ncbi:MAG TPA: sucrase ferredoxin [Pseudonocardiaceae bacterium]